MTRNRLLVLSAAVVLAVLVAVQASLPRRMTGRHGWSPKPMSRRWRRAPMCSTVYRWSRHASAATTTAMPLSVTPGPTPTTHRAATTAATPATTFSTAICWTRRTCRSSAAPMPSPAARCTTRTPMQPSRSFAATRSAPPSRSTTWSRRGGVGPRCEELDRQPAGAICQRPGELARGGRAGQPGQGR